MVGTATRLGKLFILATRRLRVLRSSQEFNWLARQTATTSLLATHLSNLIFTKLELALCALCCCAKCTKVYAGCACSQGVVYTKKKIEEENYEEASGAAGH